MQAPVPPHRRSLPARVFLSPDERRLRAGWRPLIQLLLMALLVVVGAVAVTLVFAAFAGRPPLAANASTAFVALTELSRVLAITASVYLARRFLDRRSFRGLGLAWNRRARRDLLFGVVLGGALMGLIYLAEWALGWLRFEAFAWQARPLPEALRPAVLALVAFVFVGWQEELLSRGYWPRNLADGLSLAWGVLLSSSMFAVAHLGNPNVSWIAVVGLAAAGLLFAYGYLRTRLLWLPIGLHIGWNFFEGPVFGFPVSGLETSGLIQHTARGPEVWTGGPFGPEAGLVVFPTLALGAALIYVYTRGTAGSRFAQSPERRGESRSVGHREARGVERSGRG